jgi:AbrB family looped-hinge helix DNA binding protein
MAKVTSKLQVTVPKALAQQHGITPGDTIELEPAGDVIRVVPSARAPTFDLAARLRLFDQATERLNQRTRPVDAVVERGWTWEELYVRGPRS